MITKQELAALVQILNRAAMSQAEQLWVQTLILKLESLCKDENAA